MKRIVKVAIVSMLFTILLYVNAFAETKEVKLNVDKDYTNAIFYITWDLSLIHISEPTRH